MVESRYEAVCTQGKIDRTNLQIDIFRRQFYEPNSCVSSYLENTKTLQVISIPCEQQKLHETSFPRNLLEKYLLACMYSSFNKILYTLTFPAAYLEQFLRAIWFKIGKGVCQGCILSPCLFNLYVEFSSTQFSCSVMSDCDPMDCSMPGFPVHHQLPEPSQTNVH